MKNAILGFLLGIIVIISLAATPVGESIMTFKPALPKSQVYIVKYVDGFTNPKEEVMQYIYKKVIS